MEVKRSAVQETQMRPPIQHRMERTFGARHILIKACLPTAPQPFPILWGLGATFDLNQYLMQLGLSLGRDVFAFLDAGILAGNGNASLSH